jgi:hypothetical protein
VALDRTKGGYFNGTFLDGNNLLSPITVQTSLGINSYQAAQVLNAANKNNKWKQQSGVTVDSSPNVNWVASDVAGNKNYKDIALYALFVHELGNAIAIQLKIKDRWTANSGQMGGVKDQDIGSLFEICVFGGGIVGLQTGRVGPSREY